MKTRLLISVLATLAAASCIKEDGGGRVPLQPGETLPEFRTATLEGRNTGTADLLGRPSLLILFSTTCPDCHRQLPEVEAAHRLLGGDAAFLAVARDEGAAAVGAFWKASGFSFPAAAPGDRTIYDLFDRGSRTGVPQVYLCDPLGTVLATGTDRSPLSSQQIVATLLEALTPKENT